MKKKKNLLSIVVITRDRASELSRTLYHLTNLNEQFPVIVIDNASSDRTQIMVETLFPDVIYQRLTENLYAVARNIGVELASTPYIAFSDDDSWWHPDSLSRAVRQLQTYRNVGALAARILVNDERKPDPINRYFETSPLPRFVPMPGPSLMGFLECAVVMRKKAYLDAGGYNSFMKFSGEGSLLSLDMVSAGWGISYDPGLIAYHYPSSYRDMGLRFRMGTRNAIWRAWLRRPAGMAVRVTTRHILSTLSNPSMVKGLLDSVYGLPYVVRNRRIVSPIISGYMETLDIQRDEIEKKHRLQFVPGEWLGVEAED